jgi:hypothetical protein
MRKARDEFEGMAGELQAGVEEVIETHVQHIRETLDILRSDHEVEEEDGVDAAFRDRVEAAVRTSQAKIRRIQERLRSVQ